MLVAKALRLHHPAAWGGRQDHHEASPVDGPATSAVISAGLQAYKRDRAACRVISRWRRGCHTLGARALMQGLWMQAIGASHARMPSHC